MNAIIFSNLFEPNDEFKQFYESIGYQTDKIASNFDLMFDPRVVDFCKNRLSKLWGEKVYKGKESSKFRCGFAGAGYIRDIDITRPWIIKYNHVDAPIIEYVSIDINTYGRLKLVQDDSLSRMDEYIEYLRELNKKNPERAKRRAIKSLRECGLLNEDGSFKDHIVNVYDDTDVR